MQVYLLLITQVFLFCQDPAKHEVSVHSRASNYGSDSTSFTSTFIDSFCQKVDELKFCYLVTKDDQYFLRVSDEKGCSDSIPISPFVWEKISDKRVFCNCRLKADNVIKISATNYLIAVPSNLDGASLIQVRKLNDCFTLVRNPPDRIYDEIGFIYDARNRIIGQPIIRGKDNGQVALWKFNEREGLVYVGKHATRSQPGSSFSRAYINEVINLAKQE